MRYPINIEKGEKTFVVSFPDIPEALTAGYTHEEALEMAEDALVTAMDFYFEDRRPVPTPSKPARGQETVELPALVAAKVLLLNEMLTQKVSNVDLAKRIGKHPQEMQRITDLGYQTSINTVAKALRALGKHLDFKLTSA
ncbi:MAG: type II toxin-antitoxin system HicB family antitoxin [Proteobacteria bacterium]|nr:type II toxin-antitoxin system HicB family antitoxin [Pseudomonadota bacterium]MCL2307765.1 type II toxin-antitoxin system HicB family antitoxin [Pseudomonadota bacterium]